MRHDPRSAETRKLSHVVCFGTLLSLTVAGNSLARPVLLDDAVIHSERHNFRIEVVAENLEIPWTFKFLPDGRALVGEREAGRLSLLNINSGQLLEVTGLPPMFRSQANSSGLFDVLVHPDFINNQTIFLAYGIGDENGNGLAVDRYRLQETTLLDRQTLFSATPLISGQWHFGGRLALVSGELFITTGDGYNHSARAQDLTAHSGKILRLREDGSIPSDNPFVGQSESLPEIYSYGVRNPQGMAVHPLTGEIWFNEHGPQGGDEINIAAAGANFGWPVITYGEEYGGGPVGDGIVQHEDMAQPHYYWVPSIAPSGMSFYNGSAFPEWQQSLFIGSLAFTHLNRLVLDGNRILHEERLLQDRGWRIRFVEAGPEGYVYFGVDNGMVLRLVPEA